MIERQTFNGRDASVMYFDANFKPVPKGSEDYVRIFFDDGETIVLTPPTKEGKSKQKFNPHHEPAGGPTGGQFSSGDGGGGDGGDKGAHVVAGLGDETSKDFKFPEKAGTVPIPDGHVRLYHQTSADNLAKIGKEGIKFEHARGIEGPKGIYADEQGFYGEPGRTPTAEFHVSKDRWDKPFVTGEDVKPEEIIALHYPWHSHARYIESHPKTLEQVLNGEHDDLLEDREHGPAIRYIQAKYAEPKKAFEKFNPHHEPAGSSEGGRFAAGDGGGGGTSTDEIPHAGKGGEPQTAYHGVKSTDGEFKLPDPEVEKVVARVIGIHVAKDPELGKTFTDLPGRPQQAFGEGPSDLHVLDIPHDSKLYDVEQDKSKEADENKIGNLVYKTAFKQDAALFARYLGRQWELPKDRATKLADDILHDRPATITGFGPVNGLDDYFAKQGVVTIWHNKDRAQAVHEFWDEFKGKGWQGLKYTATPIIPSEKVKDHTAYVVFDPADIKFKEDNALAAPSSGKIESLDDFEKAGINPGHRSDSPASKDSQQKMVDQWNTHVGMPPAQFKKEFLGGMDGSMDLMSMVLTDKKGNVQTSWLGVDGNLLDKDGKELGEYKRTFKFASEDGSKNIAETNRLFLKDEETGKGIGKTMLRANVDMFKKLGVEKVLTATEKVGGYAWAKYGYVLENAEARRDLLFGEKMIDDIDEIKDEEDRKQIDALATSDDPHAIWAIADSKYGKQLLMDKSWAGMLDLKDEAAMKRFDAYVGKK